MVPWHRRLEKMMWGIVSNFLRGALPKTLAKLSTDWTDDNLEELCEIAEACSLPDAICEPEFLLGVMWVESRGAHAEAMNPGSSATGLIQWMGQKAASGMHYYGLSRKAFTELGVTGQLPFVRRWFLPHRGCLRSAASVYVAVFLPRFVKGSCDMNLELCAANSKEKILRDAYLWNKYFDRNKDGKIQVWELDSAIAREVAAGGARCEELFGRLREIKARRNIKEIA